LKGVLSNRWSPRVPGGLAVLLEKIKNIHCPNLVDGAHSAMSVLPEIADRDQCGRALITSGVSR
jgi:hypothetical protein